MKSQNEANITLTLTLKFNSEMRIRKILHTCVNAQWLKGRKFSIKRRTIIRMSNKDKSEIRFKGEIFSWN